MNLKTIIINKMKFKIESFYSEKTQYLIDEICLLCKMLDKIKNFEFEIDEHTSNMRVGYTVCFEDGFSMKFMFFSHHTYTKEKKYEKNYIISGLIFYFPENFPYHLIESHRVQFKGFNLLKTKNIDSAIEILEKIKLFIINA